MKNNMESQELKMSASSSETANAANESNNNRTSFLNEAEQLMRNIDNLFRKHTIDGIGGGYQGL